MSIISLSSLTELTKHGRSQAGSSDIRRALAAGDAVLAERAKPDVAWLRTVWRQMRSFAVAVTHARGRNAMLAEANRIKASRPELAAQLRRAARGSWD